ncbi:hypothetical protein HS088_TW14G00150 [Tripterygium wilfordii]|uniref:Netrin receptor DCC n=1 Tax=Tripterygium wilfordii TaxID=458696 RepID=A0A7J7CPT5_TRIWF|nr:uncharacterized protein LOC120015556 [Tripterygium wilfordii]XP_038723962.1 uncharacterized protein LOC120015556 [Tripterygium wilfordii]XP_038723963.1 uncharacterized protein LOC120015556 [Tripterygium wilfordii]XP_038723964.1 uncharacterized protein LOC120015556 [Tripterygium wilfordii]KAF5736018.1 hypothetical protein HS088_TW14G00150 [Tripterygium wilfordii]
MPTFTAIALDRFLEPGASRSVDKSGPNSRPIPNLRSANNSKLERGNSTSVIERRPPRPQISPALYATPETTPLPDSPSSFPPSPYIINHKRRGPRLMKSASEVDVLSRTKTLDNDVVNGNSDVAETNTVDSTKNGILTSTIPGSKIPDNDQEERENGIHDSHIEEERHDGVIRGPVVVQHAVNGVHTGKIGSNHVELGSSNMHIDFDKGNGMVKPAVSSPERDLDSDDFFDPQDSMSVTSNTDEDISGAESSLKLATPIGEFYDAWEELSSESGLQTAVRNIEAELSEIRLSLLMEIEKRKQAEEALNDMRSQWEHIRQRLALVGVTLPQPIAVAEGEHTAAEPAEELCRQVNIARFVSHSIGRGIAKAEMEAEMEAQVEVKNFEIARLADRLQYYEAVNREMSQRNQDAIEMGRRNRQIMKLRQRWVWGSIATAITLGTAALAWSYLPSGDASVSSNGSQASESNDAAKQ